MRTETITKEIYKFEELTPEVQEEILERERIRVYEDEWVYESIMEWVFEELRYMGFPTDNPKDCYWSFEGYGRNTGIGFKGNFDFQKYIDWHIENYEGSEDEKLSALIQDFKQAKQKYSCLFNTIGCIEIDTYDDGREVWFKEWTLITEDYDNWLEEYEEEDEDNNGDISDEVFKTLADEFLEWLKCKVVETQKRYEKFMIDDFECRVSDEGLKEEIENNEMEFLKDGTKY